jgi:hypothetical protein
MIISLMFKWENPKNGGNFPMWQKFTVRVSYHLLEVLPTPNLHYNNRLFFILFETGCGAMTIALHTPRVCFTEANEVYLLSKTDPDISLSSPLFVVKLILNTYSSTFASSSLNIPSHPSSGFSVM